MTSDQWSLSVADSPAPLTYDGDDSPNGKFYEAIVVRAVNTSTAEERFVAAFNWGAGQPAHFARGQVGIGNVRSTLDGARIEANKKWHAKYGKGYSASPDVTNYGVVPAKLAGVIRERLGAAVPVTSPASSPAAPDGNGRSLATFETAAANILNEPDQAKGLDMLHALKGDIAAMQTELDRANAALEIASTHIRNRLFG